MRHNDFCINTKETGCVWGQLVNWECVELAKKTRTLTFLGKYTEYNGKNYVVLRSESTGDNYIIEI